MEFDQALALILTAATFATWAIAVWTNGGKRK